MYTLTDHLGNEKHHEDLADLEMFLAQPYEYWKKGTGESAVQIKDGETLIFFKTPQGIFIMQHPDYYIPIKEQNKHQDTVVLMHYVSGEAFKFPDTVLYSEEIAFEILKYYIENKDLDHSYKWVDLYSIIEHESRDQDFRIG